MALSPTIQATVSVTDPRVNAPSLHHQGINSVWNKLYSVGSYYLDLSLKTEAGYSVLLGKVVGLVGHSAGAVHLLDVEGGRLESAALKPSGAFRLSPGSGGNYGLELELGGERFVLSQMDGGF